MKGIFSTLAIVWRIASPYFRSEDRWAGRILLAPSLKASGHQVCKLEGQVGAVYSVAYRPDGKQVASAGFDGKVRLNDPDTGKLIKEFIPVPLNGSK